MWLERAGDILILNVFFVLTSIPVVTLGPSLCALYQCFFKIVKGSEQSIITMYFRSFKTNFIQSFISWLIILFFCFDIFIVVRFGYQNSLLEVWYHNVGIMVLAIVLALILLFVLKNIFAIIAYFDCNLQQGFVNSIVFPCKFFARTFLSLLATAVLGSLVYFFPFAITFAVALMVYIDCSIMLPAFRKLSGFHSDKNPDSLEGSGLEEAW